MTDYLNSLLTDRDDILKVLRKRKKKYIEKTISSDNRETLEKKAELEEKDGWWVLRKSTRKKKKSYRLAKDKPPDEQLEDEIWTIAARMGFDELSDGRNFTIHVEGGNPRQIDVFAKDSETAILIECTCCEKPKKKNMGSLIEKIESFKSKVANSINSHYGKKPKLKLRWVIATRNIEWGGADLDKAKAARIIVLRDQEIDYYGKLTDHLKSAAKYQFLSHLFAEESISGLDIKVPATRGKMGGITFYNFLIKPKDLLKIAYIGHKASRDIEDLETYQRMLTPSRLKKIAEYIDGGGQFPTNIVINIKSKKSPQFDKKEKIGDSAFGTLHLPSNYSAAWVIDGQHRLYGYSYSKCSSMPKDSTTLPVIAYENLPSKEEASLFVDINYEQVRVAKNLLIEIYSNLKWDSEDYEEHIGALRSRIILALDQRKTSPIYGRIKTTGSKKTSHRCLTLTNFNDGIEDNKLLGEIKGSKVTPGPLTDSKTGKPKDTLKKAIAMLSDHLSLYAEALPEQWALGDSPGGYLCTNAGIRALLRVYKEILQHVSKTKSIELDMHDPEDITPLTKKYVKPIIDYFKAAPPETIKSYRARSGKHGVNINSFHMMAFIHKEYNDFLPSGLKEYLKNIDEKGTEEARTKIDEIQKKLFSITIELLKKKYPTGDEWWFEGIPHKVRESCRQRFENDKGKKKVEQYLLLIDYHSIAASDWNLFQKYYSFSKDGGKIKQLQWLVTLNEIRNITHHPEKWPAMKDQVAFVKEIHPKIMERFTLPQDK